MGTRLEAVDIIKLWGCVGSGSVYQVAPLRVLTMATLRLYVLFKVIQWVFHKEQKLVQDKVLIEKCW